MQQIPEDLIQQFMQMTGMSREEAERSLAKSVQEMISRYKPLMSDPAKRTNRDSKPKYDEDNYPYYLPSDDIKKYTIRVSLKGISPAIWRKFECPSNISLRHLADLVIMLMGWDNSHMNHIQVGKREYYVPYYQHNPDNAWGECYFQEDFMLSDVLFTKGKSIQLEYDFGDSWLHEIKLSSIAEYDDFESHDITFKGGKRACPPEDCGGVWGYQELLDLHAKLKARKRLSAEEKERLEWYFMGKDYDPEDFDEYECIDTCDMFSNEDDEDDYFNNEKISLCDEDDAAIPVETIPLYDEVLALAFSIRQLEPWQDLNDSDVYAVRMQDGSDMYVSTLGNGGTSFDIQLFDSPTSFQQYLFLRKGETLPEYEIVDTHAWADYRAVMFQEPGDEVMMPFQYRHIEEWASEHNVTIEKEHGYPFIQLFRPHRYPALPSTDEKELARFKEALQAVEWFSQLIIDTDDITTLGFAEYREYATDKGGKVVPLIIKTPEGYKVERTELPGLINECEPVILTEEDLMPLRSLKKSGTFFYRLLHVPGVVGSKDNPNEAYTALTIILVNKKTEEVSITEPCDFTDTYELDTLRKYIAILKKNGQIPQRIIIDNLHTKALLKDFCQQLGIILEYKRTAIPQLSEVCQYIHNISM